LKFYVTLKGNRVQNFPSMHQIPLNDFLDDSSSQPLRRATLSEFCTSFSWSSDEGDFTAYIWCAWLLTVLTLFLRVILSLCVPLLPLLLSKLYEFYSIEH
jgi:hypothetical protein